MPIHYVPNDPLADPSAPYAFRVQTPRDDPPSGRAGFHYEGVVDEGCYDAGTPEFLFWQCSESALAALEMFGELDGPLGRWAQGARRIDIRQDVGIGLNAFYDRESVRFFHHEKGAKTTWSGASQDVVAHEIGHALLDAVRPDLWTSFLFEVNAFHEGFGDIVAILTALHDRRTREALLAEVDDLRGPNFVEATAEDLSDGIRRERGASHNAARPRRAFNEHEWALPTTLPSDGPPHVLLNQVHSFGQVVSGCFWDVVGNVYNVTGRWTQAGLWSAARTAGRLLIEAVRSAPETARFTRAIGEAMLAADAGQNGGRNETSIRDAFAFHGIVLGAATFEPSIALATPRSGRARAALSRRARADLLARMGVAPTADVETRVRSLAGHRYTELVHHRPVPLDRVCERLEGVVAIASEPIVVERAGPRVAVVGALPNEAATVTEVETFVESLVEHDAIDFDGVRSEDCAVATPASAKTHIVERAGGQRVLSRVRMACPAG